MDRLQLACCVLAASAFILAGILVTELGALSGTSANANMVIDRDNFALMTAQTAANQDSLFVVDNTTGELLIYTMNLPHHRMDLIGSVNLKATFGAPAVAPQTPVAPPEGRRLGR